MNGKKILPVSKFFVLLHPISRVGVVAQLVERRTENPCVTGSNPVDATPKGRLKRVSLFVQYFVLWRVTRI